MKNFSKLLVVGLASACLLSACGTKSTRADQSSSIELLDGQTTETASVKPDAPMTLPLGHYGAPISTLTSPRYPDRICTDVSLKDLTEEEEYNLDDIYDPEHGAYGFKVYSDHDYQLVFQLHSEGDDIQDIEFVAKDPCVSEDHSTATATFFARNRTTTQDLMMAVIHFKTNRGAPTLELSESAEDLCAENVYLGDIGSDPTEVIFEFHVQ